MRIRYVVSSMIFWGREHPLSLESECDFLKSLGYGIELWPNIKGQHECRYARRNWPRLAAATEGMLVAMRSRHDSPTLEQWNEQIECAKLLGAPIVTDLQSMGVPDDPGLNGCDFATEVVKLAGEKEVVLCLETCPTEGCRSSRLATLKEVGRRFESIRYCLDTSQAYLDSERSFKQYVDDLGPRVTHLHLTDNYGSVHDDAPKVERPRHRNLRDASRHFGFPDSSSAYQGLCRFWCGGGMPREVWDYVLEALSKYDNDVVGSIEMSPCMPSVMIRQASEFLFDVLEWPNRPKEALNARI